MSPKIILVGAALLGVAGCAHRPLQTSPDDPRGIVQEICQTGKDIQSVKGSVWLKAKSKEASGQFPAQVAVESPSVLKMEVTNLVGGTEAVISVDGDQYAIDIPKKKNKVEKRGVSSWGGIPLRWANELFLGRIPCPSPERMSEWKASLGEKEEQVVVELPASSGTASEKYVYQYKNYLGKPWPESLVWERASTDSKVEPVSVAFEFADPEDHTRSPKRWEAKSKDGEVKVRWRDRQVQSKE